MLHAARKVPGVEASAVRAGVQLLLDKTSHLFAQHIVYDELYHGIPGQIEQYLRRRIEGIEKILSKRKLTRKLPVVFVYKYTISLKSVSQI